MKNNQKGFIVLLLIAVIAVPAIIWLVSYKTHQAKTVTTKVEVGLQANTTSRNENNPITINAPIPVVNPTVESDSVSIKNNEAADEIRARNFELLQAPYPITFGEALGMANYVSKLTKIRPAFLLAIFQEELALEKFDMCYVTNLETGDGIRVTDNLVRPKTMHPTRDVPPFIDIMKELGRDPLNTLVTCPMSFGWGGAMGPADFIPSTWILYKQKIESITKKPADPWNSSDAFLAAGLFLSDTGAKSKTYSGEWKAAMIYFSGSASSPHHFYADGALKIAEKIQKDIVVIEAE